MSQRITIIDAGDGNDSYVVSDDASDQVLPDRATDAVGFQVADASTSLVVVRQFRDEANLRRRAYFNTLDLIKSPPTRLRATDRRA